MSGVSEIRTGSQSIDIVLVCRVVRIFEPCVWGMEIKRRGRVWQGSHLTKTWSSPERLGGRARWSYVREEVAVGIEYRGR